MAARGRMVIPELKLDRNTLIHVGASAVKMQCLSVARRFSWSRRLKDLQAEEENIFAVRRS
jgi:hypothetical protein